MVDLQSVLAEAGSRNTCKQYLEDCKHLLVIKCLLANVDLSVQFGGRMGLTHAITGQAFKYVPAQRASFSSFWPGILPMLTD